MLWLSELVAGTTLKGEAVHKSGPRHNPKEATRTLQDAAALCQSLPEDGGLQHVLIVLVKIIKLVATLIVRLGAQYHVGVILTQLLARNLWLRSAYPPDEDAEMAEVITTIPVRKIWKWFPNMYWVKRLSLREPHKT